MKGDNDHMAQLKLTADILAAAVLGFEQEKAQIDQTISAIKLLLDGGIAATAPTETAKPRKKFRAATRRKMAAAQRARYSKLKQGSEPQAEAAKPKKRKMSAAGRRAISLAAKKRWRAIKAAKKAA